MTQSPLLEIVYYSETTEPMSPDAVQGLLEDARKKNAKNGVTGLLCYDHRQFLQIIEGEIDVIMDLFHEIQSDDRHTNVRILHEGEIEQRAFDDWKMAYEAVPSGLLPTLTQAIRRQSKNTAGGGSAGTRIFTLFMDEFYRDEPIDAKEPARV